AVCGAADFALARLEERSRRTSPPALGVAPVARSVRQWSAARRAVATVRVGAAAWLRARCVDGLFPLATYHGRGWACRVWRATHLVPEGGGTHGRRRRCA